MSPRRTFLKVGLASAAAAALAVAVAVPVSAHTGALFTVEYNDTYTFATISGSDASVAPIGAPLPTSVDGIEIFDEVGYALVDGSIATWDHTTGVLGTPVALVAAPGYTLFSLGSELDATNDGTLLTYALLLADETGDILTVPWVVSIDPTTGVVTPEVDVTAVTPYTDAIATHPVTGVTYAFIDTNNGPEYATLDLETGTLGARTALTGIAAALGAFGYFGGADFDASGTLWFYYYGDDETILASTTGEFGPGVGAVSSGAVSNAASINLATDPGGAAPAAAPALPATGIEIGGALALVVGLLGAGTLALITVRRRTA